MTERTTVAIVLAAGGLLLLVMAGKGARGRLPRNPLFGLRTPATMHSNEAWLAAHRAAARPVAYGGVAGVLGGLLALATGTSHGRLTAVVAATCAALLTFLLAGAWRGERAAARVSRR